MAIVTALQVLSKPSILTEEDRQLIREKAEELFRNAFKSAQESVHRMEIEIEYAIKSKHYQK